MDKKFLVFVGILFIPFILSSCDDSFQPLEENDRFNFSMYGFLDASADTQWVHITPVREQVANLSDGTGIQVTVENVDTGRQIVMNDSLFLQGRNFLNFWTTEPIQHNQTYRLKAELDNGKKSEVTIVTPEEMPPPKFVVQTIPGAPGAPPEYFVLVDKNINLADIQTIYYVRLTARNFETLRVFTFPYRNLAEENEDFPGYISVEVDPDKERQEIERQVLLPPEGQIQVVYRQVFVAASGIEWNEEIESLDDITYALPETVRNVENGLGFMIGIDGKYIPYRGCRDFEDNIITCGTEDPFW